MITNNIKKVYDWGEYLEQNNNQGLVGIRRSKII